MKAELRTEIEDIAVQIGMSQMRLISLKAILSGDDVMGWVEGPQQPRRECAAANQIAKLVGLPGGGEVVDDRLDDKVGDDSTSRS